MAPLAALQLTLNTLDGQEFPPMERATPRPFTSRTRVALAIARGFAAARGDQDLSPRHIALGILREGANPAIAGLWYAGLSETEITRLRFEIEHSFGDRTGRPIPRQVALDLTPGEDSVIRLAEIEADRIGDDYVGSEHILLAVLRFDDATAEFLAKRGVSVDKYQEGLSSARRGDPPPEEPRAV
jgi:ATP-dependent Clp protease ATP-binding subunit ClpC